MNNLRQMLLSQKFKQIPQNLVNQLEQQLKAQSPQAYQEFLKAKKDNVNPNEYLNKVIGGFSPQQRQQWDNMMGPFMNQQQTQNK